MVNGQREAQVKQMNSATITKILAPGLILVMLLAFASPVVAESVAAEDPEAEEFYYRRAIAEEYQENKATIISAKQTPQGSDWVVFGIDTKGDDDKGLGVGVIYGHGNAAGDWEHATATFIAPFSIVEFIDDGDGKFELGGDNGEDGGDNVISVLPLHADNDDPSGFYEQTGESDGTMTWLPRPGYEEIAHQRTTGPQGSVEVELTATTTDGIFEVRMHISNSVLLSEDLILSPYEIKLDFVINDYPYESEDSILALCSIVASANANWNAGLPETYDDWRTEVAEDGMYFDMGDVSEGVGYFSWYENATLDGVDTPGLRLRGRARVPPEPGARQRGTLPYVRVPLRRPGRGRPLVQEEFLHAPAGRGAPAAPDAPPGTPPGAPPGTLTGTCHGTPPSGISPPRPAGLPPRGGPIGL